MKVMEKLFVLFVIIGITTGNYLLLSAGYQCKPQECVNMMDDACFYGTEPWPCEEGCECEGYIIYSTQCVRGWCLSNFWFLCVCNGRVSIPKVNCWELGSDCN